MAEPESLLLRSLRSSGIRIPSEVCSVAELESAVLISICAQSLKLIGDAVKFTNSFSESSSIDEQVKVCTEMASAMKRLGYLADISFHQFLYPSEEESCKLISFLVEKISESSEIGKNGNGKSNGGQREDGFESYLEDWVEREEELEAGDNIQKIGTNLSNFKLTSEASDSVVDSSERDSNVVEASREFLARKDDKVANSLEDQSSEMERESKTLEFDDKDSDDSHIEKLMEKVDAKKKSLQELNSQWEELMKPLEEEKETLQNTLFANNPETREKFQKLKEIKEDTRAISSEIVLRKDELSKLSQELANQPEVASRKSYIDRVKEITQNSRKQDADIERILKDTRDLQLESNSIQERLQRTYAIVDEMVFREAKKDSVGRQAYRLLTSIHECFEQISEKILATDRVRREVTEREKKLAAMASRCLNVDKLQADLDAIRKENEQLQKGLGKEEVNNPLL